jgi:hypothetical protein
MAVSLALVLAAAAPGLAQGAFKVPFAFQAGGKKLPAGDYTAAKGADGGLVLRQESTGREIPLPLLERIAKPVPPPGEPRLVFDEVGDFAPSYTEYVTVYILSEVWFPGEDGFRTHLTKGAHKTKTLPGGAAKK